METAHTHANLDEDTVLEEELEALFQKEVDIAFKKAMRFLSDKDFSSKSEKYIYNFLSKNKNKWSN